MKVADLLDGKVQYLLTVKPNESVGFLARKLQQHRVGVLIVSRDGQTLDGIISERDIAYSLADRRGELHLLPVSALMTRRVVTCTMQSSLPEVMQLMRQHHIRHVPVVEEERVVGIISIRDVMEFRLSEMERRYKAFGRWLEVCD
jgi:CBS domain-containing protein